MKDFREALARFRDAVWQESERTGSPGLPAILARQRQAKGLRLRWAAAAAMALMLAAIPVYENVQQRQREAEQEKADALLFEQTKAGISRSVPRAMAPLMVWTPVNVSH